jgi:hypothetical protein
MLASNGNIFCTMTVCLQELIYAVSASKMLETTVTITAIFWYTMLNHP